MPSYKIDIAVPVNNIEELIETLRGIGGVESLQFTISADTRREAVRETFEALNEHSIDYRGIGLDSDDRDEIDEHLRRGPSRPVALGPNY